MLPQIVVTHSEERLQQYIDRTLLDNNIPSTSLYILEPETKEFGIKVIKQLIEEMKFSSNKRLFVLKHFTNASNEAQNALLKTLEEHQPHDLILIHTAYPQSILPTISSRAEVVYIDEKSGSASQQEKPVTTALLEKILNGDSQSIFHEQFRTTTQEAATEVLNNTILFLRKRLDDPRSAHLLKNTIENLYRLEHVNLAPQTAVDHTLIQIFKSPRQ